LLSARSLRAFADGLISVLLPLHLLSLGYNAFEVGIVATATLLGSAALTLAIGLYAGRLPQRIVALSGCFLMIATGVAFSAAESFWLIVVIAAVGTLNPSVGDVSLFLPMEQARLADLVPPRRRTHVFAYYSLGGTLAGALGTLAAPVPQAFGIGLKFAFLVYVAVGLLLVVIYLLAPLRGPLATPERGRPALSKESRRPILILTSLFCIDAFGGGFVLQSLLALWLFDRFGLSVGEASRALFAMNLLAAFSQLAAPWVARRLGLINTMVFTHLPSNIMMLLAPFAPTLEIALALLFVKSALSSMDVAPRTSLIVLLVPPEERAAATSVAAVPRALAAAGAPAVAGALLAASTFGWSLVAGAGLKIIYDVLLLMVGRRLARERGLTDFR
jgi:predicted MFS family arabinose efflux permease